jgi:hypothetical protein
MDENEDMDNDVTMLRMQRTQVMKYRRGMLLS